MEFEALKNLVTAVCKKAPGKRVILFGSSSLFASTLVTLIRAGLLDAVELSGEVFRLEQEPAYIAECSMVMKEILSLSSTPADSPGETTGREFE